MSLEVDPSNEGTPRSDAYFERARRRKSGTLVN